MLRRRSHPATALLSAIVLAAAGCGDDEGAAKDDVRLALFLASAANSYAQAHKKGVQDTTRRLGASVKVFDGKFDSSTQFRQLQDAIASGRYDGFVVSANDGNALVPMLEDAIGKGIEVACILAPCGPRFDSLEPQIPGQVAHVGKSFPESGRQIGELIVRACADKRPCDVAYIPGLTNLPLEQARTGGVKDVVSRHPSIEMHVTQEGKYLAETALPVARDALQADPGLDVIASSGDQMIAGAEQAVEDAGQAGKVALIGGGGNAVAVKAIKEGRWFGTSANLPFTEGAKAAELVIKAARGEKGLPKVVDTDKLSPTGGIVDRSNAGKFEPQFEN